MKENTKILKPYVKQTQKVLEAWKGKKLIYVNFLKTREERYCVESVQCFLTRTTSWSVNVHEMMRTYGWLAKKLYFFLPKHKSCSRGSDTQISGFYATHLTFEHEINLGEPERTHHLTNLTPSKKVHLRKSVKVEEKLF